MAHFIMQKKSDFEYIKNLRRTICSLKDTSKNLRIGISSSARNIDEIDAETEINDYTMLGGNTMDKEKGIDVSYSMGRHNGYSMAERYDHDRQDETTNEPFLG